MRRTSIIRRQMVNEELFLKFDMKFCPFLHPYSENVCLLVNLFCLFEMPFNTSSTIYPSNESGGV